MIKNCSPQHQNNTRILFIANTRPVKATLENSLLTAFSNQNLDVDVVYPKKSGIIKKRHTILGRVENRLISYIHCNEKSTTQQIEKRDLDKYTFVFVTKGSFLTLKTLQYIKQNGLKVIGYNPDDPYNPYSSNRNIQNSLKLYDLYFIWSTALCKQIESRENIPCRYLPFAADPSLYNSEHFTSGVEQKYALSFIGNWDEEREKLLVQIEQKEHLVLFGNNWGYKLRSQQLKNCFSGYPVVKEAFAKTVKESVINLNILRLQNKDAHNMRTFEIPASGGFMLHEYSEDVASFFKEGEEIEFFRNVDELNTKISYYLKHPQHASEIGNNAYNKVLSSNYTYDARIKTILKEVAHVL